MKHSLTIAILLLCAAFVQAQDKIITRDGRQIEAKVERVKSNGVEYRMWNNLTGPLFEMTDAEAVTIIFSNGTTHVFQAPAAQTTQPGGYAPAYGDNRQRMTAQIDDQGLPIPIPGVQVVKWNNDDDDYRLGGVKMDEERFELFLQKNCTPAYERFRSGVKMKRAGWALFGSGLGIWTAGLALCLSGIDYYVVVYDGKGNVKDYSSMDNSRYNCYVAGAVLCAFGSAALTASIPLMIVGIHKKDHAYETYNEQCARSLSSNSTPEFRLNLTTGHVNGLGVSLNF